jgi:hypothetical protein
MEAYEQLVDQRELELKKAQDNLIEAKSLLHKHTWMKENEDNLDTAIKNLQMLVRCEKEDCVEFLKNSYPFMFVLKYDDEKKPKILFGMRRKQYVDFREMRENKPEWSLIFDYEMLRLKAYYSELY